LLAKIVSDTDAQTLKPQWGAQDSHPTGHGTQMAGLAIYGDLAPILADSSPITLTHGVQSLKLIHQSDQHRPDLYGTVTVEGISRLEIDAATRRRLHRRDLPGTPDVVLQKYKLAIFVHGCFWHQHRDCRLASRPKTRGDYWGPKLASNVPRDERHIRALDQMGWRAETIWECETRDAERLEKALSAICRKLR
jgi:DNA mismatch endonuclease, patch repair protein